MSNPVPDEPVERDGAGVPDGFRRLWAPYRMAYIKGEDQAATDGPEDCPFCRIPKLDDAKGLIVARGEVVYTVMNKYPYNAGHVMVVPYRHVADYTDLDGPETAELAGHTKLAMRALRAASGAQGFNIGMNMGGVARGQCAAEPSAAGQAAAIRSLVSPSNCGSTLVPAITGMKLVSPPHRGTTC